MEDYIGNIPEDFDYNNEVHGINPLEYDDFGFRDREENPIIENNNVTYELRRRAR
jgi:hypothetical protein